MKKDAQVYGVTDPTQIFVNQANLGIVGEKKYLISSQWWRKWCDYANFGEQTASHDSIYSSNAALRPLSA